MTTPLDAIALAGAGVLAGLVGSSGGITSLISYPALLAVGLPALSANVTNNVALVACLPGSALSSGPELRGRGEWLRRWIPFSAAGGAAGSALLLLTPAHAFERIVPALIAGGSLALLFEPRMTAWRARRHAERGGASSLGRVALPAGLLVLSLYNGYFGAGAGVMTLTLLLLLVEPRLPVANALKNVLIGAASAITAVLFSLFGSVDWIAAPSLALGLLVGSNLGPRVVRRVPAGVLRAVIAALGLAVAVKLAING